MPPLYTYISNIGKNLSLKCQAKSAEEFGTPTVVEELLRSMSSYQITSTMEKIAEDPAGKKAKANNHAMDVVKMTQLHIRYVTYILMADKVKEIRDPNLRGHFTNLSVLVALRFVSEFEQVAFACGYLKLSENDLIGEAFKLMLDAIRPQAIPLVELMYIPDEVLCSAIGNSYGDIYETQFEWAKNSRINN